MGRFAGKAATQLGEHFEPFFVAAHELVRLFTLADVAGSAPVRVQNLLKVWRAADGETAFGVSLDNLIVANLAMPGRERNVQTPNLRLFELLNRGDFPVCIHWQPLPGISTRTQPFCDSPP